MKRSQVAGPPADGAGRGLRPSVLRWLVWLGLVALLAVGAARLRFDTDVLSLLPDRLEVVRGLGLHQRHFTDARELMVVLEDGTAEGAAAAAQELARALRAESNLVARVVWQPPWLENRSEAAELVAFLWLNSGSMALSELADRLSPGNVARTLEETRQRLATSMSPEDFALGGYDPYGLTRLPDGALSAQAALHTEHAGFASADGTRRLLFVQARPELGDYRACRLWMADLERVVTTARAVGTIPDTVRIGYTGRPAFVAETAGGMEEDMAGSSGGTLMVIALLFWLSHRRLRPLAWLMVVLVLILGGTLALGGVTLGRLNVVSLGFAAILLGLAEDFGIVLYQESRSHPELEAGALRRRAGPGIWWSAITTAGAFLTLNLSVLPGLRQLGTLVALGVLLAAGVMLYGYLPVLLRLRRPADRQPQTAAAERWRLFEPRTLISAPVAWGMTWGLLGVAGVVLAIGGLRFDRSPEALEPRDSQARAALRQVADILGQSETALWVLAPGRDDAEVALRLERVETVLAVAVSNREIAGFTLPTRLWPDPDRQASNRAVVASLVGREGELRASAIEAGFTTEALGLTERVFETWRRALTGGGVYWPTNATSRWLLDRVAARSDAGRVALGLVQTASSEVGGAWVEPAWISGVQATGAVVSGWGLLGRTIFEVVLRELPWVLALVGVLVVGSLWFAFRSVREVLLSLATIGFAAVLLGAVMHVLGWAWNLMNLMALPLLMGMSVDFSIHLQLALRAHDGDRLAVRRSMGRALLLAGATTVAGFASLSFATNRGIASLGQTCALGITLALLTAVYLLPVWWCAARARAGKA